MGGYGDTVKSWIQDALANVYEDEYGESIYDGKAENIIDFTAKVMNVLARIINDEF